MISSYIFLVLNIYDLHMENVGKESQNQTDYISDIELLRELNNF